MEESNKILGRVPHSSSTEVRVTEAVRKGEEFVDIRSFYLDVGEGSLEQVANRDEAVFKPTKKGVFMKKAVFMELMADVLIPAYERLEKGEEDA